MSITFVGHPYACTGVGEQLRSHLRAAAAASLPAQVLDIFRHAPRSDPEHTALVAPLETQTLGTGLRVFHVNADEVLRTLRRLAETGQDFAAGRNVIVPAWELSRYPAEWAGALRRFDAVWALSGFIQASLQAAGIASTLVGQPVELPTGALLPRRYFGLRESAFVLLGMLDLTSFSDRKNPQALLDLADRLRRREPWRELQLVLKVKAGEEGAAEWAAPLRASHPQAVILDQPLDSLHTRSLLAACDCLVSLHRAEGFGRTIGEAMWLGRLVLATGYSGSLDLARPGTALLAHHRLVPVPHGAYPHAAGQVWAEPDVDDAVALLDAALHDRAMAQALALAGQRAVRIGFSNRAVGLRLHRAATLR